MNTVSDIAQPPVQHKLPTPCGAHLVARALKRHGVEVMFGQSLPSALYLVTPELGIRQIAYRTENAGGAMADGYARASNKVAVVTAQNGPAAALLAPALAEAYKASVPIVAIVQDVRRNQTDKNAFQELDHFDVFRGCAKWVRRVSEISRIEDYVDMAFTAAASGRPGPAVLLCPQDLLLEAVTPELMQATRRAALGTYPLDRCVADPERIAEAAALLASAANPLVVAGGGVHLSGAHEALAQLQESASLPVATSSMGKGAVDETHALSVGMIGYFMGTRGVARHLRGLVDEADVILFVGARANQNGTDSWTLFPKTAKYIHIDVDGQEVGRNYEALRLVGDAKLTLSALNDALAKQDLAKRSSARSALTDRIAAGRRAFRAEAQGM
ncbi:MAG TPA: thiamine pyrophosphate-binding protein, partial [Burkholderiales bacterium]|nr:thiamine pyrophosphate-binding protein [Burkholderiales bacterium]